MVAISTNVKLVADLRSFLFSKCHFHGYFGDTFKYKSLTCNHPFVSYVQDKTPGGGCSTNVYTGRLRPGVQTLTLLYTIFYRKRNRFRIPPIDQWDPFHIPSLELSSLLTAVNGLSLKYEEVTKPGNFLDFFSAIKCIC